jgi:hypothetical protein
MKTRRSFLSALSVLPLLGLDLGISGCGATPATVLSAIEAGINDAEIAITTITTGVNAYFTAHPNATLQAQIDNAITDVTTALSAVNSVLAGATSILDSNVQAALQAFASAYSALMTLVGQIGIQTAPVSITAAARVGGILYIPAPRLLQLIKTTPSKLVSAPPIK